MEIINKEQAQEFLLDLTAENPDRKANGLRFATVTAAHFSTWNQQVFSIEASILPGLPQLELSGFAAAYSKQAQIRVMAALKNTGLKLPLQKLLVSCLTTNMHEGNLFDLPIALALLKAANLYKDTEACAAVGQLGLDGSVHASPGMASALIALKGFHGRIFIPLEAAALAESIQLSFTAIQNLRELFHRKIEFQSKESGKVIKAEGVGACPDEEEDEYAALYHLPGQYSARRALLIAAAGRHSVLFLGSPGSGKTELARHLVKLLPDLSQDEYESCLQIYSAAGLEEECLRRGRRPAQRLIRPGVKRSILYGRNTGPSLGEVALGHNGILLLEEICDFSRQDLNLIQELMDEKQLISQNEKKSQNWPANIQIVATGNPCPCGRYLEKDGTCRCAPGSVLRNLGRLSEAFRQRMELWVEMRRADMDDQAIWLESSGQKIGFEDRKQVEAARKFAERRGRRGLPGSVLKKENEGGLYATYRLTADAGNYVQEIGRRRSLSLRVLKNFLSVARSVADLEQKEAVDLAHVAEASQYLPREYGAKLQ